MIYFYVFIVEGQGYQSISKSARRKYNVAYVYEVPSFKFYKIFISI